MELLDYMKASEQLRKYNVHSIRSSYVSSADDAVKFAKGKPIVLKLISNKALHKSKSGLVKLNLNNDSQIRSAFSDLSKKGTKLRPYRIIAQELAKSGIEIIIGGNTDVQFGKMVLLGLGGIYVETFKDVALRICPITKFDAEDMIDQLKSGKIITNDGKNREMLVKLLLNVSKFISENKITELDLNPVIIRDGSYDVVDIRVLK